MRHNHLRELLRAGKPSLGTHVISPWPAIYELVGRSGAFDYVEFVAEEAPFDLDLGVRRFSMGTDLGILANWLRTEGGTLRAQLDRLGELQ